MSDSDFTSPETNNDPVPRAGHDDVVLLHRVQDVCQRLSLSPSTVKRLIKNGLLPSVAVGRTRRVTSAQLKQFVADLASGDVTVEPRPPGRKPVAR